MRKWTTRKGGSDEEDEEDKEEEEGEQWAVRRQMRKRLTGNSEEVDEE